MSDGYRNNIFDLFIHLNELSRRIEYLEDHYNDIIMIAISSKVTSVTIVYSTVYSDADQRKHQSSALLALVRGIHRWPVNSPHKGPVTRKMFPFDDVIIMFETVRIIRTSLCALYCILKRYYTQIELNVPLSYILYTYTYTYTYTRNSVRTHYMSW